jgi:N utilization substance protein A
MEIWQRRVIVADEDLDFDHEYIDDRKNWTDFEIGEEVSEEVKLIDLGQKSYSCFT